MQKSRSADEPDQYESDCKKGHIQRERQGAVKRGELSRDPAEGRDQDDQGYVDHGADARALV